MPPRRGMPGGRRGVSAAGEPLGRAGRVVRDGRLTSIFKAPAGGKVNVPSQGPIETLITYKTNLESTMRLAIMKRGKVKGTAIGIFHIMTNGLFNSSFIRKVAVADRDLEAGKIDDEQCKLRKMRAAADYYRYLQNIGYYDEKEVSAYLHLFANQIGVEYVDGHEQEEPSNGMTR